MVNHSQDDRVVGLSVGQGSADDPAYTVEQALYNLDQTEDSSARYYAAWWIGRFRVNEPIAIQGLLYFKEIFVSFKAVFVQSLISNSPTIAIITDIHGSWRTIL